MRNRKPTQDTYLAARAQIARTILASPLTSHVRNQHNLDQLNEAVLLAPPSGWSFLSVEFGYAGTNCTLTVESVGDWHNIKRELEEDAEGNQYMAFVLNCQVNWPCHGSTAPAASLARLELYRNVALLAAAIEAEWSDVTLWKLYRTKAERAELEAKTLREKHQNIAASVVSSTCHNFRVDAPARSVPLDAIGDLPEGEYPVDRAGKKFLLTHRAGEAWVIRLA